MTIESIKNKNVDEGDGIEISRFCAELVNSRHLILFITTVFTLMALIYVLFMPVVYKADALIQVEAKKSNNVLKRQNGMQLNDKPVSAIDVNLIRSRHVIGATVDELNLQVNVKPEYLPFIGGALEKLTGKNQGEMHVSQLYLPGTSDVKVDQVILTVIDGNHYEYNYHNKKLIGEVDKVAENNGVKILVSDIAAPPGTRFTATYTSRLNAIDNVLRNLTVSDLVRDSGMIKLTLTGSDRDETIRILNSISRQYLKQNISEQSTQDSKSLTYLEQQLPSVRNDLDRDEDELNTARENNGTVNVPLEAKYTIEQLALIDNQINELTISEAEISQLYTKEHPVYKILLEKREALLALRATLKRKISGMPTIQQEMLRLTRNVESEHDVYMRLLTRQQELKIAISSAIGNARIVDNAVDAPEPVSPKKLIIILQGLLLGLFVSANLIFTKFALNKSVESSEELEQKGLTVYLNIPFSDWTAKSKRKNAILSKKEDITGLLMQDNPTDLAIEALRSLQTNMHFSMLETRNNILMISSASANAGKTFLSTNFSAIIAQSGKKVLLIDADLRRGTAHHYFNTQEKEGLSEILVADYPIDSDIAVKVRENLDFVNRGQATQGFTELLMSERFSELMRWAEKTYDLVIVDTPPVLAVTDAEIIGSYAGTTILLVRSNMNTIREIEMSRRRFERNGITVNGYILNGVTKKMSSYHLYVNYQYS